MIPNAGVAQSPGYAGASPIYQANANMVGQSYNPATIGQSPQYSPSHLGGQKPYSPGYGAQLMSKSPGYSPTSGLMARGASPLNMAQGQNSPAYSPTSMNMRG